MPRIGRASYRTPRLVPGGGNAKASYSRSTAIAVARPRRGRLAANIYTRRWQHQPPSGKGSKAKPLPVGSSFNFRSATATRRRGGYADPDLRDRVRGPRDLSEALPDLHVLSGQREQHRLPKCKKAKAGGGLVQNVVGARRLRRRTSLLQPEADPLQHQRRRARTAAWPSASTAIRRPPPSRIAKTIGCPTPIHRAIKAKFVKTKIGGLAGLRAALHGAAGAAAPVRVSTTSCSNIESPRSSRSRRGQDQGQGPQGRLLHRRSAARLASAPSRSTFTDEQDDKKKATQGREVLVA